MSSNMSRENLIEKKLKSIITKDLCITVLNKKFQTSAFQLIDYKVQQLSVNGEPSGYGSEHNLLKCTVLFPHQTGDDNLSIITFFIKLKSEVIGTDRGGCASVVERMDMFRKEALFYQFVQNNKATTKWCPQFYGFFHDHSIVLENLENVFQTSKLTLLKYDYDHCLVVLKAIAALHASSIQLDYQLKLSPKKVDQSILDAQKEIFKFSNYRDADSEARKVMEGFIDGIMYLFRHLLKLTTNKLENQLQKYIDVMFDKLQRSSKYYNVVNHGDLHGNNMLFRYDSGKPIECCLIDFSVIEYMPPAFDVLMFLFINTSVKLQKQHLKIWLDYYYQTLIEQVKHVCDQDLTQYISQNEFQTSCEEYLIHCKILAAAYKSALAMENSYEFITGKFTSIERAEYLKKSLDTQQAYKETMTEVMEDIKDTLLQIS